MVVCVLLPRLALIAALGGERNRLMGDALALAPEPGREQRVGEMSPAAEAFGIVRGMRVGEALSRCPDLRLITPDPEATRAYWNDVLDRIESLGAAPESDEPGVAWFEADGLRRLYGGHLEGVLAAARRRLPAAVRLAAASCRFAALAAARQRRRRSDPIVPAGATRAFLAPLPVGLLRTRPGLSELPGVLERLGISTLGELAALPPARIAERFGQPGLFALELAQGSDTRLEPRRPVELVVERLTLPEAASGMQLERGLELLLARLVARRERRGRSLRGLALSARFVEGGGWRVSVSLRAPTVDPVRLRLVLAPRLAELPAPAESLAVEVEAFGPPAHDQHPLVADPAEQRRARLGEAVRHVRGAAGGDAVMRVLEIDPGSRLPERRAVLAPYPHQPR
jgi:protein ImuB